MRSTRLFKLCCNVLCEFTEWFICFANVRAASHQVEWPMLHLTVELPYISGNFQWLALQCCCVVNFMNTLTLLYYWFTIYSFLAPWIADTTILYSCKVLKTRDHHLNHKHKFTRLYAVSFDSMYRSSILLVALMEHLYKICIYVF